MKKIGIVGDMHMKDFLSYSDYFSDKRQSEENGVLDYIISFFSDCDAVVFLGDQFHLKNNTSETVKKFVEFIERLGGKKLFFIAGNHEIKADRTTAIDFLAEIKNKDFTVINKSFLKYENVVFCPYFRKGWLGKEDDRDAAAMIEDLLPSADILFAHQGVTGIQSLTGLTDMFREIVYSKERLETKFKKIVIGHIHNYFENDNVLSVGSTCTDTVGEHIKYIHKIDLNTLEVTRNKLPCRGIYSVLNPTKEDMDNIPAKSIFKLLINDPTLDKDGLLEHAKNRFDAVIFVDQPSKQGRNKTQLTVDIMDFDINNLVKIYAKERKTDYKKLVSALKIIEDEYSLL